MSRSRERASARPALGRSAEASGNRRGTRGVTTGDLSTLEIRSYQPGDETAINALFEVAFSRPLPAGFWSWRYTDSPAGGPWIELAWDNDRLAAHYAVSATTLSIDGGAVPAALSMTTMTHPDYRGRGLFPTLGGRLYERFAASGGTLVYGFPNANSHRGFVRDLLWQDLHEIPTLRAAAACAAMEPPAAVTAVAAPDPRFDRLWDRVRGYFPVWVWRDARWLAWRLCACPGQDYGLAAWQDQDEIRGWVAVKRYGTQSLDIIDLVAEDEAVARDLASWALWRAARSDLSHVATWCPMRAPWRMALEASGFRADAPVTYMGTRVLSAAARIAEDPRAWGFSMADSDVY